MKPLSIAITGAGIGGLAAASLLADQGHTISLFERFVTPRPVGSGLVIQPVGLAVLDRIGAGDAARALGAPIGRMLGHQETGRQVLNVSYRPAAPGLAMHRAALFEVLWQAMLRAGVTVIAGADVAAADLQSGKRLLRLTVGDTHGPFDLIVDAGGAGSPLSPLTPRALPFGAIWGHVPWPADGNLPPNELRQRYHRASNMAGILPIGSLPGDPTPRAAVFWSLPVAALDGWAARDIDGWKRDAIALWPEIAPFLAGIARSDQMTPARYSHGSLSQPFAPPLVHIGDAAHRASPQLGQGANMALLDALALTEALRLHSVADALPAYARMRRWHVRSYQVMSRLFTPMYQSDSRALPLIRDHILGPMAGLPVVRSILTALVSGDMIPPVASTRLP